jgi:hypothetical protein
MKKRKTIFWIFGLVIIFLFAGGGYILSGHPVIHCYLVKWSDLEEIADNIYVDPDMPDWNRNYLINAVEEGEDRVGNLFGDVIGKPIIIAGHTMDVMQEYGGNSYNTIGRTYLTLLGAYIVLGPDGITMQDVIAHELAHAELTARIGHKNVEILPDWFEEGLALQVDYRFTEEDWAIQTANGEINPELSGIGEIKHDDVIAYVTAKHEISRWLDIVGQQGFLDLLQTIKQGEDFLSAYRLIENQFISQ